MRPTLAFAILLIAATAACDEAQLEVEPGRPGERRGGFIFVDPTEPPSYTQTPGPAGDVPGEEGIPGGHPGFRTFESIADARRALGDTVDVPEPQFVPAGYSLIGLWVIELEDGRIVDVNLSYAHEDGTGVLLAADLSLGWTDRAPQPLPARTEPIRLPLGVVLQPVVKLMVREHPAVLQRATNSANIASTTRVNNSLNWFEEGRLWFVQAEEPGLVLLRIAGIPPR